MSDDEVYWRPPVVPRLAMPYFAVCWADFDGIEPVVDVHRVQYHATNAIAVLRACLPALGLGAVLNDEHWFLSQLWLMKPDKPGMPEAALASTITNPNDVQHYKLAVLYVERNAVWVHRIDGDVP